MASRIVVAKELSELMKIISHPDRLRLIEEMRTGERDVNTLAETLNLPQARVSQHIALMRAHRLLAETRDGRRHLYSLKQPEIADWILDGIDFIKDPMRGVTAEDFKEARTLWSQSAAPKQKQSSS